MTQKRGLGRLFEQRSQACGAYGQAARGRDRVGELAHGIVTRCPVWGIQMEWDRERMGESWD